MENPELHKKSNLKNTFKEHNAQLWKYCPLVRKISFNAFHHQSNDLHKETNFWSQILKLEQIFELCRNSIINTSICSFIKKVLSKKTDYWMLLQKRSIFRKWSHWPKIKFIWRIIGTKLSKEHPHMKSSNKRQPFNESEHLATP